MKKLSFLLALSLFGQCLPTESLDVSEDSGQMLGAYDRRVQRFEETTARAQELQQQLNSMTLDSARRTELQERLNLALANSREIQDSLDQMENHLTESLDVDNSDFEAETVEEPVLTTIEPSYPQATELVQQRRNFDQSLQNISAAVDDMEVDQQLDNPWSLQNQDSLDFVNDEKMPVVKSYGKAASYQSMSVNDNGQTTAWKKQTTAEKPADSNSWYYQTSETTQTPDGQFFDQSEAGQAQDLSNFL